jgi:hypothetical protein
LASVYDDTKGPDPTVWEVEIDLSDVVMAKALEAVLAVCAIDTADGGWVPKLE